MYWNKLPETSNQDTGDQPARLSTPLFFHMANYYAMADIISGLAWLSYCTVFRMTHGVRVHFDILDTTTLLPTRLAFQFGLNTRPATLR